MPLQTLAFFFLLHQHGRPQYPNFCLKLFMNLLCFGGQVWDQAHLSLYQFLLENIPFIGYDLLITKYQFQHDKNTKMTKKYCFQMLLRHESRHQQACMQYHVHRKPPMPCLCVAANACHGMQILTIIKAFHGTHMPTPSRHTCPTPQRHNHVETHSFDEIFCEHAKKNVIYHFGNFHYFMDMESVYLFIEVEIFKKS